VPISGGRRLLEPEIEAAKKNMEFARNDEELLAIYLISATWKISADKIWIDSPTSAGVKIPLKKDCRVKRNKKVSLLKR